MQGIVLKLDLKSDSGVIRADDGNRYAFDINNVDYGSPLEGCVVDFDTDEEGKPVSLCVVKTSCKARADWLFWFLCAWRGRISRVGAMTFFAALLVGLPVLLSPAVYAGMPDGWLFGTGLAAAYVTFSVLVKRFHDSGCSAGWLFSTLFLDVLVLAAGSRIVSVPFLSSNAVLSVMFIFAGLMTLYCLYLCFARGTLGENKYGKQPEPCKTIRLK